MAIQFPNFLQAQIVKPDYSGIGDSVENFYRGYHMPKDALIKKIQAQFAQPNAEEALTHSKLQNVSSRLSNRKAQMDIDRLSMEIAQQRELEKQLRQALSGGGSQAPQGMPPQMQMPNQMPQMQPPMQRGGMTPMGAPPMGMPSPASGGNPMMGGGMPPMPSGEMQGAPPPQAAPSPSSNMPEEVVVSKGSPHLAAIDSMYDNNPLSRAFLNKKGYKKDQSIKFDNKTGRTTIITKYPSGKVTVQSSGGNQGSDEGSPLTNKMVSKHQNIISSVDTAIPVLEELEKMKTYPRQSMYKGAEYAEYEGLVSQAVDSLLGSFGLPMTNEGLKTVRDQIEIKTFEGKEEYRKRLKKLMSDLRSRQQYSEKQIKKSSKIRPTDSSNDSDNEHALNMSDDDLGDIAYGS